MRAILAIAILLVAAAAIIVVLLLQRPSAPPANDLPVPNGLRIVSQEVNGSTVQSTLNHDQYRYMLIVGPPSGSVREACYDELALLLKRGWTWMTTSKTASDGARDLSDHPLSNVVLRSPAGVYAEISTFAPQDLRNKTLTLAPLPRRPPANRPSFLAALSFHAKDFN